MKPTILIVKLMLHKQQRRSMWRNRIASLNTNYANRNSQQLKFILSFLWKPLNIMKNCMQWRIQDFPEVGTPTPNVDVKSYYLANFFPKTAWNWKSLYPEGACVPGAPLRSVNVIWKTYFMCFSVEAQCRKKHVIKYFVWANKTLREILRKTCCKV